MISKIRYLFVILYIAAIIVCILMMVKPGASIFYIKQSIDKQELVHDAGYAFRYKLNVNPLFYRPQGILLFEDGRALTPSQESIVANAGKSTYSLSETPQGGKYLYLSSSDNNDPITNGRQYILYLPISFTSRLLGGIYLIILLPCLIGFMIYVLFYPEQRRQFTDSPKSILIVINRYLDLIYHTFRIFMSNVWQRVRSRAIFWIQLFTITILAVFLYTFMEWVFFITMPSFLSIMSFIEKVEVFILSGLIYSLVVMIVLVLYFGFDLFVQLIHRSNFTSYLGLLIPTIILSALSLLLIDNFTYTVFNFGISTVTGIWRAAYTLIFVALLIYIYSRLLRILGLRGPGIAVVSQQWRRLFYFSIGMLLISSGLALTRIDITNLRLSHTATATQQAVNRPNILLLGSDGLSAEHLSVYGYERDTTPRIRELAESSLVAENAFTNSGNSPGSVISIFTSKLPTTTRVGFNPDILKGVDAFQHLPGILKNEGYKNVEYGMPLYVDSYALNVQNGFDEVNNDTQRKSFISNIVQKMGYENAAYFINRITERISDRILHILYIRAMQNPYTLVTQPADSLSDQEKITQVLELLDQTEQPLFVHLHLLSTHGNYFQPAIQSFSKGQTQDQPWMTDFYDDVILSFDNYVGQIIDHLKATGQFDNTIMIIYTDHSMKWQINERIPLIIHFQDNSHAGRIKQNVQNMDIAPTILDHLGLALPEWMDGESILNENPDNHRLVFGTFAGRQKFDENKIWLLDENIFKPPFYQFDFITAIDCQKWYKLDLLGLTWSSGDVLSHTAPCNQDSLLSFDKIKQATEDQLAKDGFDTSSLP